MRQRRSNPAGVSECRERTRKTGAGELRRRRANPAGVRPGFSEWRPRGRPAPGVTAAAPSVARKSLRRLFAPAAGSRFDFHSVSGRFYFLQRLEPFLFLWRPELRISNTVPGARTRGAPPQPPRARSRSPRAPPPGCAPCELRLRAVAPPSDGTATASTIIMDGGGIVRDGLCHK